MTYRKSTGYGAVVAGLGRAMRSLRVKGGVSKTTTRKSYKPKTGYKYKKRIGSNTTTTRRRKGDVNNYNNEYSQTSMVYGRKPRNNFAQMSKLVKSNVSTTIFGMRNYSRFGGTFGNIGLINGQSVQGTALNIPLALFDITSCTNDVAGTISPARTYFRAALGTENSTPGNITFYPSGLDGIDNLVQENQPTGTAVTDSLPLNSSLIRWVQAKLMFYAPQTLPTKVCVQIVRFKDARLVPSHLGVDVKTDAFTIQFYQSLMKKYMLNPIEVSDVQDARYLKVIHSHTFILNPKDSTEATNTNFKQLDIFEWLNRRANYAWEDKDLMGMAQSSDFQKNIAQNSTTVHPLARTFLMIRAQSGYNSNNAGFDFVKQPSFDIVLRTSHTQIN